MLSLNILQCDADACDYTLGCGLSEKITQVFIKMLRKGNTLKLKSYVQKYFFLLM